MALIGTIRINMVANVEKFTKAMGKAQAAMGSFVGKAAGLGGNAMAAGGSLFANAATGAARLGGSLAAIGFSGAVKGMSMFGRATAATFGAMRGGLGALGGFQAKMLALGAGGIIYKVAKAASNLAEQSNRAGVMFGEATGSVVDQSKLMAGAFGIARSEFLATTSAMGGMFEGIGYSKKQSADLSVHFLKLATDLSSIANIPVAEALEKIQSGLAGEVRPLREVGVFMSEAAIKSQAAKMGIAALGTELTEQQKVQARIAYITEKLGYAQGDLAKTADSAENATRGFMGRLTNLAETIGATLLPIVGSAMAQLQTAVEVLSAAWSSWTSGVISDQVNVVGAVGETAKSMGYLQMSIGFVADSFQVLKMGFYAAQSYITYGLSQIVKTLAGLGSAIDFLVEKLTGMKSGLGDMLTAVGGDLNKLSESQWGKFQEEIARPAASENINAMFSAAQDKIRAMRAEAMKPGADVTKFAPTSDQPVKAVADKYASAAEAGSKEAANLELRSRYGAGVAKGPEDVTAKNTGEMVGLLRKIAGSGVGMGATMAGGVLAGNL